MSFQEIQGTLQSSSRMARTEPQVLGNYIGTNAAGTAAIPNGFGIEIQGATGNVIGSVGSGRNIISGNTDDGISLNNIPVTGNNQIAGNYIGTNAAGTAALGNGGDGIFVGNPWGRADNHRPGQRDLGKQLTAFSSMWGEQ
jgi:hypothetical protein